MALLGAIAVAAFTLSIRATTWIQNSGLPPTTDIRQRGCHIGSGPRTDIGTGSGWSDIAPVTVLP
jgi:hypothetical protein